ncbi:MAG: minor capsid protein [Clostridia bacterium]|nr:minor capsid protein [Clostridia bacterium]
MLKKGESFNYELDDQYRKASTSIEKDIAVWYQRFADNNEISLLEAKRLLNTKELDEFKWSVEQYIKYGEENAINQKWMKELENASAKVHISRLEALKLELQQHIEALYGNLLDGVDKLARNIYSEGYYHTAYEIQKGFNVGWNMQTLNSKQLDSIISKPWTADGKTFSDRIWANKEKLVNTVHTQLTQAIIRGDAPDQAIKTISKQLNVSKTQAGRLVMTESAFFASAAQKDCFNDLDVEKYEIIATLDSRTSEICQDLDGKVFAMKDYEVGVTAPPFHVWCRTCTAPYFEDDFGERAARDAEGKTYYVPSDMKYKERYKQYVDNKGDSGIIKNIEVPETAKSVNGLSQDIIDEVNNTVSNMKKDYTILLDDIVVEELGKGFEKVPFQYQGRPKGTWLNSVLVINKDFKFDGNLNSFNRRIESDLTTASNDVSDLVKHELAHVMTFQGQSVSVADRINVELKEQFVAGVSIYADKTKDGSECIAEAFVRYSNGEDIPLEAKTLIDKYIMKWRRE